MPARQPDSTESQEAVRRLATLIGDEKPLAVLGLLRDLRVLVESAVGISTVPETP